MIFFWWPRWWGALKEEDDLEVGWKKGKNERLVWLGKWSMPEFSFCGTFYDLPCPSSYSSNVSSVTIWNQVMGKNALIHIIHVLREGLQIQRPGEPKCGSQWVWSGVMAYILECSCGLMLPLLQHLACRFLLCAILLNRLHTLPSAPVLCALCSLWTSSVELSGVFSAHWRFMALDTN